MSASPYEKFQLKDAKKKKNSKNIWKRKKRETKPLSDSELFGNLWNFTTK